MSNGKNDDGMDVRVNAALSRTAPASGQTIDALLGDIPVELSVELGRVSLALREVAGRLGPGSVIPLAKMTGEPLDIRVNNRLVAKGEAVALGERYGIRITEVIGQAGGKAS